MLAAGLTSAVAIAAAACSMTSPSPTPSDSVGAIRYVALGDSYTIGTNETEQARWPDQLVGKLAGSVGLDLVANLGVNGYSSFDVIERELPQLDALQPDFVTLLIGVNDVVRGTPADEYRDNLNQIFDFLLDRLAADRIVVVSTPDYTLTPAGNSFGDPLQQRAAITQFNGIELEVATGRGIKFVDISGVANKVAQDPSLVAGDGLHPSGRQYAAWVELIAPVVQTLFAK
ncbi:MAG: SGNH/GDSL hydrolase family protein [Chloroflexota bacterium]